MHVGLWPQPIDAKAELRLQTPPAQEPENRQGLPQACGLERASSTGDFGKGGQPSSVLNLSAGRTARIGVLAGPQDPVMGATEPAQAQRERQHRLEDCKSEQHPLFVERK